MRRMALSLFTRAEHQPWEKMKNEWFSSSRSRWATTTRTLPNEQMAGFLRCNSKLFFLHLLTTDGTWFHYDYEQSSGGISIDKFWNHFTDYEFFWLCADGFDAFQNRCLNTNIKCILRLKFRCEKHPLILSYNKLGIPTYNMENSILFRGHGTKFKWNIRDFGNSVRTTKSEKDSYPHRVIRGHLFALIHHYWGPSCVNEFIWSHFHSLRKSHKLCLFVFRGESPQ